MAISRVKNWVSAEVLYASDLNAEFNNILNNATSLVSPWTANMDAGGFRLITLALGTVGNPTAQFTGDTNTGFYSPTADVVALAGGGVDLLRASSFANAVNYWLLTPSAAGNPLILEAQGSDTDIPMQILGKGTGYVQTATGFSISDRFYPGVALGRVNDGVAAITAGTVDLIAGGRRVFQASQYANATNYIRVSPSQSGIAPLIDVAGADTNIGLQFGGKGSGTIAVATGFIPASLGAGPSVGNTPDQHGLYRENVMKGWINFKGTATASIYGSFNVASLARNNTGDYTITWDRDFAATPYAIVGMTAENSAPNNPTMAFTPPLLVGSCNVQVEQPGDTQFDPTVVMVLALGGQ